MAATSLDVLVCQIYANIQPNDSPSRIAFDLRNTKHWKPFFDSSFPNMGISSVQVSGVAEQC